MTINCPYCGVSMESQTDVTKGQHVICPNCKIKFTYGDESDRSSYIEAKFWSYVGRYPWAAWLKRCDELIVKSIPFVVGATAVAACVTWLMTLARANAPVSEIFKPWLVLIALLISMLLSAKTLSLICKVRQESVKLAIRPQLATVLKTVGSIGLMVLGGHLISNEPTPETLIAGIAFIVIALMWGVCLENLSILRLKAGSPTNGVEEFLAQILLPVRFIEAILPLSVILCVAGGMIYSFVKFKNDGILLSAALASLAILPSVLSLVVYLLHVVVNATADSARAFVSIPVKLDVLRDAVTVMTKPSPTTGSHES